MPSQVNSSKGSFTKNLSHSVKVNFSFRRLGSLFEAVLNHADDLLGCDSAFSDWSFTRALLSLFHYFTRGI